MRELLRDVDALDLADEDLGAGGHLDTSHLCDGRSALADDAGVEAAVDDDGLADLVKLVALEEVAATALELGTSLVIDVVEHGHALLGGADHAVVEGLGVDDGVDSHAHVGSAVDDGRGVASADAQGGRAGAVGGLDHARATGGQDDVGLCHEGLGVLERERLDPADEVLGGTGGHGGVIDDAGGLGRAALGARVRRDHDGVAGLERDEALEDGGRGGVGRRDDRTDDADGLGDLLDASHGVLFDDTAGLGVLVGVVDVLGGVVVLGDLVLHTAHARLLDGHLGQRDTRLVGGHGRLEEDLVNLLLRKGCIDLLGLAHEGELLRQLLVAPYDEGRAIIKDGSAGLFRHQHSSFGRTS